METTISHNNDEEHWYDKNDPMNLNLPADPNASRKQVKRGFWHVTINVLLRLYGIIISVLMIAMGGYLEFLIKDNLTPYLKVIEFALMGAFFIVCGVLTLLIETRNRRTMKHCLSAYFFLGNSLARGIFYALIGGLTFVQKFEPPYVKGWWVGCAILGCAACNLLYYPFYWSWRRERDINHDQVVVEAYPEEDIYGFKMYQKDAKGQPIKYDPKMLGGNATKINFELQTVVVEGDKKGKGKKDKKSKKDKSKSDKPAAADKGKGAEPETQTSTSTTSSYEKPSVIDIKPEPSGAEIAAQ